MYHVEKMGVADISFAVQLANTMNWNMTVADFEFMIKLEAQGCLVLFHGQKRLGMVTCISYGQMGWLGNLIVKEEARREGVGNILITRAKDYLKKKGAETIGLYAYPNIIKFYENFGFKSDIEFLVLKGKSTLLSNQKVLKDAKRKDISELITFDHNYFGANRQKLLESVLLNKNNLCYISTINNKIVGYVIAKIFNEMVELGPLICNVNRIKEAVLLLKTILDKLNGLEVFAYVPKKETTLLHLLCQAGLKEEFRVMRMFCGPAVTKNCIYTAESLERG